MEHTSFPFKFHAREKIQTCSKGYQLSLHIAQHIALIYMPAMYHQNIANFNQTLDLSVNLIFGSVVVVLIFDAFNTCLY